MPFAQWGYPLREPGAVQGALPGRLHLRGASTRRAAGSTRCSRSRRCSSSTVRVPQLHLPRPDPRPRRAEDVEEPRQRGRPWDVIDAPRRRRLPLVLLHLEQPWSGYRFSVDTVGEAVRQFLLTLWNTYSFWVLYANADGWSRATPRSVSRSARRPRPLGALAAAAPSAEFASEAGRLRLHQRPARAIAEFVEELSNWYVRLSRRRFWDGDRAAFATLRQCLLETAKLLAPFTPFLADEIYHNLAGLARGPARLGPPLRLPGVRAAATPSWRRRWRRSGTRRTRPRRPRPGQGEGAPAAAPGGDRRQRRRARGDRALRRPRHGRAERQGARLRHRGGGAGQLRA